MAKEPRVASYRERVVIYTFGFFFVALILFGIGGLFASIWLESWKWFGTALLAGFIGLVGGGIVGMVSDEFSFEKPLSRADRKRIEDARRRARLEAEIRKAEQENGIG